MRKISWILVLLMLIALCMPVAHAQDDGDTLEPSPSPSPVPTAAPVVNQDFTIEPVIGYEGLLLMGRWMPTFLTVTNHGDDFSGSIAVNTFRELTVYDRYEAPLEIASGATKQVTLPIRAQRNQDTYAFEIVKDEKIIAEKRVKPLRVAPAETVTLGLLSKDPKALTYMDIRPNGQDTLRGERWLTLPLSLDTFPKTTALMEGLTMLVIDGIDVRTLTAAQQDALNTWLRGGGVVILSGGAKAAQTYPFFESYTEISAGEIKEAEDFTGDLLTYVAIKGKPAGDSIWISGIAKDKALLANAQGDGLVAMTKVDNGLIITAAFDLGAKPISAWSSMGAFWPRLMRQEATFFYDSMLTRLNNLAYNNEAYRTMSIIDNMRIANDQSGIVVFILLIAFVFMAGFGSYLLMKRIDRREWLWGIVPAVSALFAVVFYLMSSLSMMNKPVALTASQVLLGEEGMHAVTHMGVATAERDELTVSTLEGDMPVVLTQNYGYYDDGALDVLYRPVTLNQRFRYDENPSVGFASNEPWQRRLLQIPARQLSIGDISASVWAESDGIHGEITNGTDVILNDCIIVSRLGYFVIDTFLPGQRAEFSLLEADPPIDYMATDFDFKPGILYGKLDADVSNINSPGAYYGHTPYNFVYNWLYDAKKNEFVEGGSLRLSLIQLFEERLSLYGDSGGAFYFFGFNETIGRVNVLLSGEPVKRSTHATVLGGEIAFEPIGPTGVVMYTEGLIPFERMIDQGEGALPTVPTEDDLSIVNGMMQNSTQLELNDVVAGRFVLPDVDAYTIEKMSIAAIAWDMRPEFYLYNHKTGEYDEQKLLTLAMSGEKWAPYIDKDGAIYLRYVPTGLGGYSTMGTPAITVKGEVK